MRKQLGEIARPAQVPPLTESQALYILEKLVDHVQHQAPGAKRSSLGIEGRESGRDQVSVDEEGMAAFVRQELRGEGCLPRTIRAGDDDDLLPRRVVRHLNASEILCMPLPDVLGWMDVGELEGVDTLHGVMLTWGELASFGMDFWSQESIEAALGADLADAIPELLRLADLEVRIPRLEILALERLADRDGKSVDAVLARELLDVVSAHSEYLSTAIPGFTAALRWPQ